jgi:hypothetical protein
MWRWIGLALCLCACQEAAREPAAEAPADMGAVDQGEDAGEDAEEALPPVGCAASRWAPGRAAFAEADWGLEALGVSGTLLSVTDLEGDGWPDLVVRVGGSAPDDFSEGGARRSWVLRNTGQGRFEDVTEASGLRALRNFGRAGLGRPGDVIVFGDVDNDGDLDAYTGLNTTSDALPPLLETSEIMLNDGQGRFALGPPRAELRRPDDVPSGASFIDVDRDGVLDLWVTQSQPAEPIEGLQDRLYRGDGQGGFVEVTAALGLGLEPASVEALNEARVQGTSWGAVACDLNQDGWPELLASSYGRAPNRLWEGGEGGFTNRSVSSGFAFDEDQDWSDNESARCHCQLNPADEGCAGVPAPRLIQCQSAQDVFRWAHSRDREPYRLGGNTGAVVCADLDNDGWMDLLTTEIVHWDVGGSSDGSQILRNTGEARPRLERLDNAATGLVRERALVTWNDGDISAAVFDFDNDGWQDVLVNSTDYPDTRAWLYHQSEPLTLTAVPLAEGIDHHRAHGAAVADFDRDGDLDVILGHSRARCGALEDDPTPCYERATPRLFENLSPPGQWVQLRLEGAAGSNLAAIGARVSVQTREGTQTQAVDGGHGHYGAQRDLTLHFGLGGACGALVTVHWPDAAGTTQRFLVESQRRYQVRQGEEPIPLD